MLYEIRNYQFEPTLFEEYKTWVRQRALPWLETQIDLVGFWTNLPEPVWIDTEWTDGPAAANITWIIRWPDKATRDVEFARVFGSEEWAEIFNDVPGGWESYLRMEGKFAERLA
jgi:hypothetical protein